jgi:hypothetical protein
MLNNDEVVAKVTSALLRGKLFEQAGELYEKVNQTEKAFECYRKAQAFSRAIELARFVSPSGTEQFFSYALKMEAVCFSKMLVSTYESRGVTTQKYNIFTAMRTSNLTVFPTFTAV